MGDGGGEDCGGGLGGEDEGGGGVVGEVGRWVVCVGKGVAGF